MTHLPFLAALILAAAAAGVIAAQAGGGGDAVGDWQGDNRILVTHG